MCLLDGTDNDGARWRTKGGGVCVCVFQREQTEASEGRRSCVWVAQHRKRKKAAPHHTHTHTHTHDSLSVVVDVGANAIEHHDTVA